MISDQTLKQSPDQRDGVRHRWRLRWTLVGIDLASLRGEMKGVISANRGPDRVMKRDRSLIGLRL